MRLGSLFTGYGGLDLGIAAALDVDLAWVADNNPWASRVLAARFPDVPNLGDVRAVDWTQVEPVDVISGGFPCQDLSRAGTRAGLGPSTRSGLWSSMVAAIRTLRPRLVVIENVDGILSARAHSDVEPCPVCLGNGGRRDLRALGRVLGDLADLGYDATWDGVRASDVDAPHARLRIFLAATPPDTDDLRQQRTRTPRRRGTRPPDSGHLLPTPAVNDMGDNKTVQWWDHWTADLRARGYRNGNGHGRSLAIEAKRRAAGGDRWGPLAAAVVRWELTLGRIAPDPLTIRADGEAELSPRFVEWCMGLPDGWVTDLGLPRRPTISLLANGVVPPQATRAVSTLLDRSRQEVA